MIELKTTRPPMYDPRAVQPMRDELTYVGFEELTTAEDVDRVLTANNGQTVLLMVNSVCGCAAGSARPGVALALQNSVIPDRMVTVFAGQDRDAVDHVRQQYLGDFPPSSPAMAMFRDGKVVSMIHRHQIEGRSPEQIAIALKDIFDQHCSRKGPSIRPDDYEKLVYAKMCGSAIPRNS